jgi:16S rRNA (guanine966-N2)-methyltransferase
MRIVAGTHKGRRIDAPAGRDVRPTSDRVRESLFNILDHRDWGDGGRSVVLDAVVLDAFCGTGALGLEALSRGAAHVTFMDSSRHALAACRANVAALGENAHCDILQGDALHPVRPRTPCTMVLMDPPYRSDLAAPALAALDAAGWIAAGAICVVETGAKEDVETPEGFELLDARKYGAARVTFMRKAA